MLLVIMRVTCDVCDCDEDDDFCGGADPLILLHSTRDKLSK